MYTYKLLVKIDFFKSLKNSLDIKCFFNILLNENE